MRNKVVVSLLLSLVLIFSNTVIVQAEEVQEFKGCTIAYTTEEIPDTDALLYNFFIQANNTYKYMVLREIDVYKITKPRLFTQSMLFIMKEGSDITITDGEKGSMVVPVFQQKSQAQRFKREYIIHRKDKVIAKKSFRAYKFLYHIKQTHEVKMRIKTIEYHKGQTVWKFS